MSIKSYWKSSIVNKLLIVFGFLWVALAVVFGIYDLEISKALFNSSDVLAKLVQNFGEIPGILFGLFAIFTLGTNLKLKNEKYSKTIFLLEVLFSTGLFLYLTKILFEDFNVNFSFTSIYGVTLGLLFILLSLIFFYLFKSKFSKFQKRNHNFAKLSVYLFVICGFIVETIKVFWGRVRYENVVSHAANFSAWYIPQGITRGDSFPSGHAYLGWVILPLILLFLNRGKISKWVSILLVSLFGLFISFERVVLGAHYASDVLFSAGFVIITFLILYKKIFLIKSNSSTRKSKKKKKNK